MAWLQATAILYLRKQPYRIVTTMVRCTNHTNRLMNDLWHECRYANDKGEASSLCHVLEPLISTFDFEILCLRVLDMQEKELTAILAKYHLELRITVTSVPEA